MFLFFSFFAIIRAESTVSICFYDQSDGDYCPELVNPKFRYTESNISIFDSQIFSNLKSLNIYLRSNFVNTQKNPIFINFRRFIRFNTEIHFIGLNYEEVFINNSIEHPFSFSFDNLNIFLSNISQPLKVDSLILRNCELSNISVKSHFFSADVTSSIYINSITSNNIIFHDFDNQIINNHKLTIVDSLHSTVMFSRFYDNFSINFFKNSIFFNEILEFHFENSKSYVNFDHSFGGIELYFISPYIQSTNTVFDKIFISTSNSSKVYFPKSVWQTQFFLSNSNDGSNITVITECENLPCHILSGGGTINLIVNSENCGFLSPFELKGNELNIFCGKENDGKLKYHLVLSKIISNENISIFSHSKNLRVKILNFSTQSSTKRHFSFLGESTYIFSQSFGSPNIQKTVSNFEFDQMNLKLNNQSCYSFDNTIFNSLSNSEINLVDDGAYSIIEVPFEVDDVGTITAKNAEILNDVNFLFKSVMTVMPNKTEVEKHLNETINVFCIESHDGKNKIDCGSFHFNYDSNNFPGFSDGTEIYSKICSEKCVQLKIERKLSDVSNSFCFCNQLNKYCTNCPLESIVFNANEEFVNWKKFAKSNVKKLTFILFDEVLLSDVFDFSDFQNSEVLIYSPLKDFLNINLHSSALSVKSLSLQNVFPRIQTSNEAKIKDLSIFRAKFLDSDLNKFRFDNNSIFRGPASILTQFKEKTPKNVELFDLQFDRCHFSPNHISFYENNTQIYDFEEISNLTIHLDSKKTHHFSSDLDISSNFLQQNTHVEIDNYVSRYKTNNNLFFALENIPVTFRNDFHGRIFSEKRKIPISFLRSNNLFISSSKKNVIFNEKLGKIEQINIDSNLTEVVFNEIQLNENSNFIHNPEKTKVILNNGVIRGNAFIKQKVINGTLDIQPLSQLILINSELTQFSSLLLNFYKNYFPYIFLNNIHMNNNNMNNFTSKINNKIVVKFNQIDSLDLIVSEVEMIKFKECNLTCDSFNIISLNKNNQNYEVKCRNDSIFLVPRKNDTNNYNITLIIILGIALPLIEFAILIAVFVYFKFNKQNEDSKLSFTPLVTNYE
ncbi:hypothetical protein TRFO_39074 [Tritrichomonas foetus]|uniref:Uncharacterized protein n=1 Tax=Tritrichomonas foetus TaxID=1144522 RepID=A0A1J4J681_9EUKA|nr:hypothetical protein TRFO_39074 [Tritrichomonas foetus]|eukprot:OHS94726.1 hypothetical protein TRFO_39074 [Tritrichomonas foetus]